jgi:shikimate dehydrogenase
LNKEGLIGFGLIGYPLSHSWSADYFQEKFRKENLPGRTYRLFPLKAIADFPVLLKDHPEVVGLNVTIPYKEKIIPYLDQIDEKAVEIGAVNTVTVRRNELRCITTGFNTDVEGFLHSIDLKSFTKAYILGTGGGAKAVAFGLTQSGLPFQFVSRNPVNQHSISYLQFMQVKLPDPVLIINATPVGMYPEAENIPQIPYDSLKPTDLLYDLVYNPVQTLFLKKGEEMGARIQNGLQMLKIQAELSYKIWCEHSN